MLEPALLEQLRSVQAACPDCHKLKIEPTRAPTTLKPDATLLYKGDELDWYPGVLERSTADGTRTITHVVCPTKSARCASWRSRKRTTWCTPGPSARTRYHVTCCWPNKLKILTRFRLVLASPPASGLRLPPERKLDRQRQPGAIAYCCGPSCAACCSVAVRCGSSAHKRPATLSRPQPGRPA